MEKKGREGEKMDPFLFNFQNGILMYRVAQL